MLSFFARKLPGQPAIGLRHATLPMRFTNSFRFSSTANRFSVDPMLNAGRLAMPYTHNPEANVFDVSKGAPISATQTVTITPSDSNVSEKINTVNSYLSSSARSQPLLYFPPGVYELNEPVLLSAEGLSCIGSGWTRQYSTGGTFFNATENLAFIESKMPFQVGPQDIGTLGAVKKTKIWLNQMGERSGSLAKGIINVTNKSVTIANMGFTQQHFDQETAYAYPPFIWAHQNSIMQDEKGNNYNTDLIYPTACMEDLWLHNLYMLNVYAGIRVDGGRAVVEKIHGTPIIRGLDFRRRGSSDAVLLNTVAFTRYSTAYDVLRTMEGTAIRFEGTENSAFSDLSIIGYGTAVEFAGGACKKFKINNLDADSCLHGIFVSGDCEECYGMVNNFTMHGSGDANTDNPSCGVSVHSQSHRTRLLQITNTMLTNFTSGCIQAQGPSTVVQVCNAEVSDWGGGESFRATDGANIKLTSNTISTSVLPNAKKAAAITQQPAAADAAPAEIESAASTAPRLT